MSIKKKVFLASGIIAFVAYLLCYNSIISNFFFNTPLHPVEFNTLSSTKTGKYDFSQEYLGGIADEYVTSGWAFCESEDPQDAKPVSIIFKNPNGSYAVTANTVWTLEDSVIFGEKSDRTFRYAHDASLVQLPTGVYDLYLYCQENENDTMLINLNLRMEKDGTSFLQSNASEQMKQQFEKIQSDDVSLNMSSTMEVAEDFVTGRGWIFLEGQDTLHQNVYVTVYCDGKEDTYWAQSVSRQDVADYFDNPQYLYAGFRYGLPAEKYAGKTITVEAIVEIDGAYYTSGRTVEVQVPEA